jgi:hypothetical protein
MDHGRTVEAERLKEEMESSRAHIAETVEELKGAVSQAVDWREQVKAHPGASLGVVAGAASSSVTGSAARSSVGALGPGRRRLPHRRVGHPPGCSTARSTGREREWRISSIS